MGLNYHASEDPIALRLSTASIATSFDATPIEIMCNDFNQLIMNCDLSLATATDVRIQVDAANPARGPNGARIAPVTADWFTVAVADGATASGATNTETLTYRKQELKIEATGKYAIALPLCYRYIRVRAKTTAGPGATTLAITGTFGKV